MEISELCYELYKADWLKRNIENKSISVINFINSYLEDSGGCYTIEDFLGEQGFGGVLYVCYEEFLENEYLETGYIESLLRNSGCDDDVIEEYEDDISDGYESDVEGFYENDEEA